MNNSSVIQSRRLMIATVVLTTMSHGSVMLSQEPVSLSTTHSTTPSSKQNAAAHSAPTGNQNSAVADVLIGAGDLLQINLYGVPDFGQEVRVSGAGEITLPMVGQVYVRGLSTIQAESLINKRLKDDGLFNNPQISVLDREFATQGISILGEVQKPGIYPVLGPRKLFDVISAAGGMAPHAGRDILISHRLSPQSMQTVTLTDDFKRSMDANVDVFPGDTVVVSKAGVVYVVGDVRLPGGFLMDKDKELTVLQALALAQGAAPAASLGHSKVIHRTPTGVVETALDLKAILGGKAEDIRVHADDILFIPHNARKEGTRIAVQTILQTAAGVAIYRF
jgi:polysaccharide export outer membrane protein